MDLQGRDWDTGQLEVIRQHVCDEHYADLTAPCVVDHCRRVGLNVVHMAGTAAATGEHHEEDLRFCNEHLEEFRRSRTVTMDGFTMVHDGHGHLKRLPRPGGQG